MNIIITLILAYIIGVIVAFDMSRLIEVYRNEKVFTRKERIKLMLGSWYTCIILNNILDKYRHHD